jgi:hypothetical protein
MNWTGPVGPPKAFQVTINVPSNNRRRDARPMAPLRKGEKRLQPRRAHWDLMRVVDDSRQVKSEGIIASDVIGFIPGGIRHGR